jgi:hypothetical protein
VADQVRRWRIGDPARLLRRQLDQVDARIRQ